MNTLELWNSYYFAHHKTVSFHILWHVWCCLQRNPRAVFLFQSRQAVQILSAIGFKAFAARKFANTAPVLSLAVFSIFGQTHVYELIYSD